MVLMKSLADSGHTNLWKVLKFVVSNRQKVFPWLEEGGWPHLFQEWECALWRQAVRLLVRFCNTRGCRCCCSRNVEWWLLRFTELQRVSPERAAKAGIRKRL